MMRIHLTATPDFDSELLINVFNILNEVNGELSFHINETNTIISEDQFNFYSRIINYDENRNLSFDQLFSICSTYRSMQNIDIEDYVVVITNLSNDQMWFSKYSPERNIFIYGDEWEFYSSGDIKFTLAFQVVSNIFQSLLNLNLDEYENDPNIHDPSIGCINDMCIDKDSIRFKLLSAYICDDCLGKAINENFSQALLSQIDNIINSCSDGIKSIRNRTPQVQPSLIEIDSHLNITIGTVKITECSPILRTLFAFFLLHPDGITRSDLMHHEEKLNTLYRKATGRNEPDYLPIINLLRCRGTGNNDGTFHKHKTDLHRALNRALSEIVADPYLIISTRDNDRYTYKINIDEDLINIDQSVLDSINR